MGRGCAHIRWWGRKFCNFSVVLETNEEQQEQQRTIPAGSQNWAHHSDLVRVWKAADGCTICIWLPQASDRSWLRASERLDEMPLLSPMCRRAPLPQIALPRVSVDLTKS
jgi:hypothetical protein